MNADPWQHEFDVALRAVRESAVLARDIRQRLGEQTNLKADQSPVTVADFAVQALVAHRLGHAFPDDPIVAEEDAASLQGPEAGAMLQSVLDVLRRILPGLPSDRVLDAIDRGHGAPAERFWTLDPVDTQGFLRGDQFGAARVKILKSQLGFLDELESALKSSHRQSRT